MACQNSCKGKEDKMMTRRRYLLRMISTAMFALLAVIAGVFTYCLLHDFITSLSYPATSTKYLEFKEYVAPAIVIYPGSARLQSCNYNLGDVVSSKLWLKDMNLHKRNCTYMNTSYEDPFVKGRILKPLLFRGPTNVQLREAIFIHFELEQSDQDFHTVSYFLFSNWDNFAESSEAYQNDTLSRHHTHKPVYAISAGYRIWVKMSLHRTQLPDGTEPMFEEEFKTEYSLVRLHDRRPKSANRTLLFFIFFEWKNDVISEAYLVKTSTVWSVGAALCSVFLTLHKGYQIASVAFSRFQNDTKLRRQSIRIIKANKRRESDAKDMTVSIDPADATNDRHILRTSRSINNPH